MMMFWKKCGVCGEDHPIQADETLCHHCKARETAENPPGRCRDCKGVVAGTSRYCLSCYVKRQEVTDVQVEGESQSKTGPKYERLPSFPQGHIYTVTFRVGGQVRMTNCVVPDEGNIVAAVFLIERSWDGAVITRIESVGPVEGDISRPEEVKAGPDETMFGLMKANPGAVVERQVMPDGKVSYKVGPVEDEVTHRTPPSEVPGEAGGYAPPGRPSRQEQAFEHGRTMKQQWAGEPVGVEVVPGVKQQDKVSHVIGKILGPGVHCWKGHFSGSPDLLECDRCGQVTTRGGQVDPKCLGGRIAPEHRHQWPKEDSKGMPRCLKCGVMFIDADTQAACPGRQV